MQEKEILVIVEEDTTPGFRLAGVEVERVRSVQEAETITKKALQDGRFGILILEEEFLEQFDSKTKNLVMESTLPLVMPINIKAKGMYSVENYLEEMVRRAVGFAIRIRG